MNTAQRLCDPAGPAELLASMQTCEAAGVPLHPQREVLAKGKRELPLTGRASPKRHNVHHA